jgi:AraC-like DNA-binding protein
MSAKARPTTPFAELIAQCARLTFEPHDIAGQLDARGRYEMPLAEEFGFAAKLFHYSSRHHTRGVTWHERLELFIPLDFPGFDTRAIVVSFLPEFVYSLGSPSHDYAFLMPFYSPVSRGARVLSLKSEPEAAAALRRLLACRFGEPEGALQRAGCKANLLALLLELARRFRTSEVVQWEFLRQQERSLRLKKLFDHISAHYTDRLSVAQAARLAAMSEPQFMKTFKRVAGMTLVAYLNHVRLAHGARLLRETSQTIAEIASAVGFSDQSYFDKRFKRAFGQTPKEFRLGGATSKSSQS